MVNVDEFIEDIGQELRDQISRFQHRLARDSHGYFEQVRQRMPALTGNAVSAVRFSINDEPSKTEFVIVQEDTGISGDPIAGYMPEGILKVSPHTSDHSDFEKAVAISKVGRVVINPSAAQDPWRQAALDLGHTDFQRQGVNPTRISSIPPNLEDL